MIQYWKNLSIKSLFYINNEGLVCLEEWTDIIDYEGLYMISNLLRVKSLPKPIKNKNGVFMRKERILKPYIKEGYLKVGLYKNKKQKDLFLHRIACINFYINPENKPFVNHKNAIKSDLRLENLEWCTPKENSEHASIMRLYNNREGENSSRCKLTNQDVLQIRDIFEKNPKINKSLLARNFNIGNTTLGHILSRRNWKHI